jgi:hypothetical protein
MKLKRGRKAAEGRIGATRRGQQGGKAQARSLVTGLELESTAVVLLCLTAARRGRRQMKSKAQIGLLNLRTGPKTRTLEPLLERPELRPRELRFGEARGRAAASSGKTGSQRLFRPNCAFAECTERGRVLPQRQSGLREAFPAPEFLARQPRHFVEPRARGIELADRKCGFRALKRCCVGRFDGSRASLRTGEREAQKQNEQSD